MPQMISKLILGFWVMVWSAALSAGTLTAELDRTEGPIEEPFVLTITIEGNAASALDLPKIENLQFYQRGSSQQHSIMNGKISKRQIFTILVQAEKPGVFTIPSLKMEIDGKPESSLPLTLRVGTGGSAPSQTNPKTGDPGEAGVDDSTQGSSGDLENQQVQAFKNLEKTGGVFVIRQCSPTSVYVGQQIICNVRIYHPGNFNSGQKVPENSPEFRRFMPEGEKRFNQVINGRRFGVIEVTEIFVPLKDGEKVLPSFTLDAQVVSWEHRKNPLDKFFDRFGGGAFDFDFSFPDTKVIRLTHPENKTEIKPLPKAGQPPQFKGIVGTFDLSASINKTQVVAGDTVTITLSLSGKGVLDTALEPQLGLDPSIKQYADKPEYREKIDRTAGVESQKTFKIALVPSKQGNYVIGQVAVPIFDPQSGQYRVLSHDLGTLVVTPGQAEEKLYALGKVAEPSKQAVKEQGKDLFGPHEIALLGGSHTLGLKAIQAMAAVSLMGLASPLLALVWMGRRRRKEGDIAGSRRSAAHRHFKAKTKTALLHLEGGRCEEGLSLLYRGFKEFLGDLANTQGAAMTLKEIEEFLKQRSFPEETLKKLVHLLEKIERVEFSGQTPDKEVALRWLQELETLAHGVAS